MIIKKIMAIILAMAAVLSLCACDAQQAAVPSTTASPAEQVPGAAQAGSSEESAVPQSEDSGEMTWISSFSDIALPKGLDYLNASCFTDEGFYAFSSEGVKGSDKEEEKYMPRILFITYDGKVSVLDNYQPVEVEKEREGKYNYTSNTYPIFVQKLQSGELALVETFYDSWVTKQGIDEASEEYWQNYAYSQEYYFRVLNPDGSEKLSVLIPLEEEQYVSAGVLDKNGNLVCTVTNKLMVISPNGEILRTIEGVDYYESIVTLPDGTVFASAWGDTGVELYPVDTEKGEIGTGRKLPNGAYTLFAGGGDYSLYYSNGSNFYGYDLESGDSAKVFSWLTTDVSSNQYGNFCVRDDGSVFGVINESESEYSGDTADGEASFKLFEVRQVPASSAKQKKTLTLAVQWLDMDAGRAVLRFNRASDEYRIDILDYSEYNTEDDYSAGLTKLMTEVIAGNMPDMLDLSSMPVSRLAAKGLLEDLYPYIDADPELSREQFFPNVLALCEKDGKLVSTLSGFYLSSLIGASSVVGDTPGWTYEEFDAALASMPEGCRPLSVYTTRDQILSTCLSLDFDKYVNWATGECDFNNEAFTDLLEFAARFPESFDWDSYDWQTDSDEVNLASGQQMLATAWVSGMDNVAYNEYYFGGQPYTYIGYPTSSGTGNFITLSSGFGMSSSCTDKQAAWQFLRIFFTDDYQKGQYMLPASKAAFEAKLKKEMTVEYQKDDNGEYVLDDHGEKIPLVKSTYGDSMGNTYEIYAMTQEQANKLKELVETTTRTSTTDDSILAIVQEQAEAFFQGQKSAEEVARLIQSKVNIYVNEQR